MSKNPPQDESLPRGAKLAVWASVAGIALLAVGVHMAPYWHARSEAPAGWLFTGNINANQDTMQYRTWFRKAAESPLIANSFTTEPHRPYLLVPFHSAVGRVADLLGRSPESIYALAGAIFALLLVPLIYATLNQLLQRETHALAALVAIFLGGGLSDHLRLLARYLARGPWWDLAQRLNFEGERTVYLFTALFDTHYLFVWLMTTAALFSFVRTVQGFRVGRLAVTVVLFAFVPFAHPYTAPVILAVAGMVCVLLCLRRLPVAPAAITTACCTLAVLAVTLIWLSFYGASGLPGDRWSQDPIPLAIVVLTYPIPVVALAWGIRRMWAAAGVAECCLLGWAAGCLALVLAAPLWPYPVRGMIALQVPLYGIAAWILLRSRLRPRVRWAVAVLLLTILPLTPWQAFQRQWRATRFAEDKPEIFLHAEHRKVLDYLKTAADEQHILVASPRAVGWLAPEYPGRLYVGHWFLSRHYGRKVREVEAFFRSGGDGMDEFLDREQVRFVLSDTGRHAGLDGIDDIELVLETRFGALYAHRVEPVLDGSRLPL